MTGNGVRVKPHRPAFYHSSCAVDWTGSRNLDLGVVNLIYEPTMSKVSTPIINNFWGVDVTKKIFSAAALIAATIMTTGCTNRLLDFTVVSSKNVDLSKGADFKRGTTRVKGEDMRHIIVFIPTGQPSAKTAMDKAIESVPGAVGLADGVITSKAWWIPYIYGQTSFEVEGTPLIDPNIEKTFRK